MSENRVQRIERLLRERFQPVHLELYDDSARHAGHAGAAAGGGHYRVAIVSAAFEGHTRLEQHRMVNETLRELLGGEIHALSIKTSTPAEWGQVSHFNI